MAFGTAGKMPSSLSEARITSIASGSQAPSAENPATCGVELDSCAFAAIPNAIARRNKALFFMAHEYRELGEFDNMKSTYERLIDQYPRSEHRLEAYLVLGDSSFDKNDLSKAEQYYNLVIVALIC